MVSKRDCICCAKRLGRNGKRRVNLSSLHIFVSDRLFPSPVPDDCCICETCRWMHKNWSAEAHIKEILLKIDGPSKYTDAINERYEETRNGNVSNDKHVRTLDIDEYLKFFFS